MSFWNCSDPFVNSMKSFGYNIVRLPKADIRPLQLLYKNGDSLERLGAVTKLLISGDNIHVPQVSLDTPAANVSGSRTGEMKIGLGLSLLGTIIGAMGGSSLGLESEYRQAKSAVFEFQNVLEDKIEVVDLDQYLGDADINPASVYVAKLLEADKLYVTTSTIKSSKFIFEARDTNGTAIKVDVPAIQGVVSTNIKVGTESAVDSKLTYEGKIPLVFGFQAVQIYYDNGSYTAIRPVDSAAMKSVELLQIPNDGADRLRSNDVFVRLHDLS